MFSFCNPSQVRQQVVLPVTSSKYKAADGVDIDDHVIFSESFRPKESTKSKQQESPRAQHQRLEEEIFLLTLDLFRSHAALFDFERELLKKSSAYGDVIYQCQHAGATATTELVQLLRFTVQRYGHASQSGSTKGIKASLAMLKQLTELLKHYQEFAPNTKTSSPYNGNCFTSVRHALIITDIFLTNCCEVSCVEIAPMLSMLPELKDLLVACLDLAGYISSDDGDNISHSFGQILLKYVALLTMISDSVFSTSNPPLITSNNNLASLIALMQPVASGLNILRWVCGDESLSRYLVTLRFWNVCERVLRQIANKSAKEGGMSSLYLRKMQQLYVSTLPTPAEILFEFKRLETLELANVGLTDDYQLTMLLHDTLDTLRQDKGEQDSINGKGNLAICHLESKGLYSLLHKRSHLHFTLYSRFLLTGLVRMIHMPISPHVIARVPSSPFISFPDKDKWFCSIFELLTFVLKEKVTSAESRRLLPLAPFMAHVMLKTSLSMAHDPSWDWIYWSLAKSLSGFNDWLRAATRSLNLQAAQEKSNKHNASMYSSAHSVSSASLRSLEPESARHRIALTATALSALDTPFKELNRENEYKAIITSKEHPKAAFQIGDGIDALYTLPNGTKRWFPGNVTGINEDLTFCVLFDDGEIVPRQLAGDIRHTKKKRNNENDQQVPPLAVSTTPLALSFDNALSQHTLVSSPMPLQAHSPPKSMHALDSDLSLKNIPHVDSEGEEENDSEEDSDEEDRVFEIPSIFDGLHRSNNSNKQHSNHRDVVPRMQLTNLPMSSSLPHSASTPSLSGALLRDVEDNMEGELGGEYDSGRVLNSIRGNSISPSPSLPVGRHAVGSTTPYIHSHRSATHRSANNGMTGNELEDSLESSFSSLGAYSIKPITSARPNLAIGNFSEAVREESMTTGGNTRMLSWRGEDSARAFTGRISARSNLHKPSAPPGDMMLHSAREVSSIANSLKQSKKTSSGTNSSKEEQYVDLSILFHEFVYPYLLQTYALVGLMVLKRCFVDKDNVDYACCIGHVPSLHASSSQLQMSSSMVDVKPQRSASSDQSVNPLYHIREFLELCNSPEIRLSYPSILSTASNADSLQRLCKMLHGCFFDNCLKDHMNTHSTKVGEGGFGSVYKVVCPEQCGRYKSFSHCYGCYKKSRGRSSSPRHKKSRQLSTDFVAQVTSAFSSFTPAKCMSKSHLDHVECQRAFAVKRIPRERSLYDQSMIFALYQEISALEKLHNLIGVCGVEDYGVVSGEYWLVMEHGWCSLSDWRSNASSFKAFNPSPKHDKKGASEAVLSPNSVGEALGRKDIATFLMIFLDILYILRDVHKNDVAHFDLKGSNFILREDPSHSKQHIWNCLQQNKSSGVVFLADFGEAIPNVSSVSDDSLRKRSRGTMAIQSPEMLCISESMGDFSAAALVNTEDSISGHTDFTAKKSSARRSFRISVLKDSHVSSFVSNTSVHTVMSSDANVTNDSSTCKSKLLAFPVPSLSSDVWSLGCLLIELLSGNVLFHDRSWPELYTKLCLSESHSSWSKDLECLSASLECLDDDVQRSITDIALAAMHKDVKQRASIENLIVLTKSMLDKHFVNDILTNKEEGGGILTYSNSGDSQDDGRFNSHAIELNSLEHELPLKKVDEVDEDAGQLDDIARSLGIVSTEVFSVLQFQANVWVGCEGVINSLLTPFLSNDRVKSKVPDGVTQTRLTCQSLLYDSYSEEVNAHLFLPMFKVDELINAGIGTHAVAVDCLSDILWNYGRSMDESDTQPVVIWIKVSETKEGKSTMLEKVLQAVSLKKENDSRVKVVNLSVPHEGSSKLASLRHAVKDTLNQIMGYCSDLDVPPILLVSVEDNDALSIPDESEDQQAESSYRHIDKTVFSIALSVASMLGSATSHSQLINSASAKCDNMEALRLLGKLLRTMPWMDSLLDVYLVQDLVA